MFSPLVKIKRRIKKLLKVQSETRQKSSMSVQSKTMKILMLVLFSVLVGIFYPGEALYDPLDMPRKGEIADQDLLAPFPITVNKTEREIREERDLTARDIPYVIDYDSTISKAAFDGLHGFVNLMDSLKLNLQVDSTLLSDSLIRIVSKKYPFIVDSAVIKAYHYDNLSKLEATLDTILTNDIYRIGVMPDLFSFPDQSKKNVVIRHGERMRFYVKDQLFPLAQAVFKLVEALNKKSATDTIDVEFYHRVGRSFIQPNLKINMAAYNKQVENAVGEISKIKFTVEKDDPILYAGKKVTERQERILRELSKIQRSQAVGKGFIISIMPILTRILLVFASFLTLYFFLYFFRRDFYRSNPKLLAVFFIFMLQLVMIYMADIAIDRFELSVYLYPVTLLAILMTILFDAEVGVLANFVLALLLGILHRFDFHLALMTISIGTVACFTSQSVRNRASFFKIMYTVAISFVIFILIVENNKLVASSDILTDLGFGIVNGILIPLLAIGILPIFEAVFSITTDITLLELSDLNHPLLKRLALEAPGTYHHSIVVGTLSEAAAKAVGGNPLLARVGAYFHDIGKMEIPEYFVENQMGLKSKHEELTPSMSSIILSSHVKKGRQLGEESDIPDDVLNFIEEHHGTMVQSYFYNKAKEMGMDEIDANKFRYPGPKPQTRETGIAMLADAVEAASRTLDEPKPSRINNLIQRIINDRFESGELDDCPLTLKDLAKIKEAFAQILIGSFHQRIKYPKKDEEEDINN